MQKDSKSALAIYVQQAPRGPAPRAAPWPPLAYIDKEVPKYLELHLIVDNYCTHNHAKVNAWLAHRLRLHVHYTPTYASLLNQVERWFGIITQKAIRRGSFSSVLAAGFRAAVGADRLARRASASSKLSS